MHTTIVSGAAFTLASCGVLALLGLSRPARSGDESLLGTVINVLRALHDRDLNRDADDADVAGYYQGLLAGRPRTLLGRSKDAANYRNLNDFLYYEAKPNVDWPEHDGSGRHVTNSVGLSDREYTLDRRPGTRRIALIGDSITRGQGAPFGQSFEALFEERLNASHKQNGLTYELINFSTTGYRLTQMLDVALEKVPSYQPDVYVICLTRLSVGSAWGDHLSQLVLDRIDLKYPYLRDLARRAGLDPRDPVGTMRAKLEPYRLEVIRWALQEFHDNAKKTGAQLVVAYVPTANSPASQERRFGSIRAVVDDLGLPLIDLLGVFDRRDLTALRVAPGNDHPNSEGHRLIAEFLYDKVLSSPRAAGILLGTAAPGPGSHDSSARSQ